MRSVRRPPWLAIAALLLTAAAVPAPAAASRAVPPVPAACKAALRVAPAGVFCDSGANRGIAATHHRPVALKASGRRSGSSGHGALKLFGPPLRPGQLVRLTRGHVSSRAQLVLAYAVPGATVRVRFARFGGSRPLPGARVTSRRSRGAVVARLQVRTRIIRPVSVERIPDRPKRPTPTPAAPVAHPVSTYYGAVPFPGPAPPQDIACGDGTTAQAVSDSDWDRAWSRNGPGWTGGDASYSVGLPDGRVAWLFGDTFLGNVNADGSRSAATPFVRNSMVVQDGGGMTTVGGGAMVAQPADAQWYWPGSGFVEGGKLRMFLWRFRSTGPGPWDFQFLGNALGTAALPGLAMETVTGIPSTGNVSWGSAVLEDGAYTYIYGVEDLVSSKYLHIARAPRGHVLDGAWEYATGGGWSSDPGASARVLSNVSNQNSVLAANGHYVLISQEAMFGRRIFAYTASSPTGPWSGPKVIYTTPPMPGGMFTYNAVAHPELTRDGQLLVSYNVNSFTDGDVYADASRYRPRFFRAPLDCLAAG